MDIDLIVQMLAAKYGVTGPEALAVLGTLMFGFRVLGKLIPDDKRGVAGFIRKASKILGAYVANKEQSADADGDSFSLREQFDRTLPPPEAQTDTRNFFARDESGRFIKRMGA